LGEDPKWELALRAYGRRAEALHMRKLLILLIACLSLPSFGQVWSGIINSNRAIDWSSAGVVGGIPDASWTQCGSTIAAYSGTAATINAALSNCSGTSEYVLLGPGTFTLSTGIVFSNVNHVVLRGSGPKSTIVNFTAGTGCVSGTAGICVQGSTLSGDLPSTQVVPPCGPASSGTNCANWTAGYSQGTTSITIDNVKNLAVGQTLVLDQANDTTPQSGVGWFSCDTDTGTSTSCSLEGGSFGRVISGVGWNEEQFVQVTSISGTGPYTVGISPGVYATNIGVRSKSPGAWWTGAQVQFTGIENMTLSYPTSATSGIAYYNATNSWIQNVRSLGTESIRNHVWLFEANHITVQNNYFFHCGPADDTYVIEYNMTSDNLVQNNITQHASQPVIAGASAGNVFAYNFSTDQYTGIPTYMASDLNLGHGSGVYMNLYEGNQNLQAVSDVVHGTNGLSTHFRNQYLGWYLEAAIDHGNSNPVNLWTYSYQSNFVGNVLGKVGFHTKYIDDASAPNGSPGTSIFVTGFCASEESTSCSGLSSDRNVLASTLLWGNYDVVNGSAQWNCTYAGGQTGCPYTETLPSSFFLSATPSWWVDGIGHATIPFPAIGPDVSGGSDTTGHAYTIPAGLCYANSSIDTSYQSTYTISAGSWSSSSPGATTLTVNNTSNLLKGDQITITGVSPSGYNGTFIIQSASGTTITYYQTSNPGTYSSGGSFTWPNILLFDANACYGTGTKPAAPTNLGATIH